MSSKHTTLTSQILASYHQQQYSLPFQKMMNKAVSRIYKQRITHNHIAGSPHHSSNIRDLNKISLHQVGIEEIRKPPVRVSSFFQVPLKEQLRSQHRKQECPKLEPLKSKPNDSQHQRKHPMLLNYKLQRYETLNRDVAKSVDDLISDIKIILRNKSNPRKKTLETHNEYSNIESPINQCKLQNRQPPKHSNPRIQYLAPRQRQRTEGSNWSPWGTKEREEEY